ncbi:MAG: SDR family oxidoreductase [Geminicoccaceae bacterium]
MLSGGSSGIGLALAHRLGAAGWDLTLLARDQDRLAAAKATLLAHGGRVETRSADVAEPEAVEAAVASAIAALGPPRLLVACAGIVVPGLFLDQPLAAFHRTMAVNYLGALHLVRAALPAMRMAGQGHIVLVASGAALIGLCGYGSYAPSKFAVRGLGEALRSELKPDGIGVSVAYPPDTDTPGLREELRLRPAVTSELAAAGGLMSADQVAAAILGGVAKGRFAITPGAQMTALAWLHSLIGPWLHRFQFDPVVARHLPARPAASADERPGRARVRPDRPIGSNEVERIK